MRVLALDPGLRRTGVALSDELGLFAHPRPAIHAATPEAVAEAVAGIVSSEGVAEVVVGLPLHLSGSESDQSREVRRLAALLRRRLPVPVVEWDERLSTREAARNVKGRRARERGDLDSAAAALILQSVLDARRPAGAR
jgi:putative Holliday junction resolvase